MWEDTNGDKDIDPGGGEGDDKLLARYEYDLPASPGRAGQAGGLHRRIVKLEVATYDVRSR